MLRAEAGSAIDAARWEIELMFKEMKSEYRLNEFSSKSPEVNLTLIYASLPSFVLSKRLQRVVVQLERKRVLPHDRWARVLRNSASELLALVCSKRGSKQASRLLEFWRKEAPDPNRNRALLAEQSSKGVCAFC